MATTTVRADPRGAQHVRLNTGVLAAAEKRLLVRIADRLPARVNSDHLTLLALLAMAGTGASFWLAGHWPPALMLVVLCLALNWLGDSLDGTLARVRRHERPRYGYYVDHVLDVFGMSLLVVGLALSGYMSPVVALSMLAAYLLVSAEVYLATSVNGTFRMSFLKVGPTELRILLAVGALMLFTRAWVTPFGLGPFLLFDIGGVVATGGLIVAFLTAVIRGTRELYRAEPLPKALAVLLVLAVTAAADTAVAAQPEPPTLAAWKTYVNITEARMRTELSSPRGFLASDFTGDREDVPQASRGSIVVHRVATLDDRGREIEIPGGTVQHWRGTVFLPGVTLAPLVNALQHPPEHGPFQVDVLAMRVERRSPGALDLFIRMSRSAIVTVTYDTEHHVEFMPRDATRISTRSVSTRITEVDRAGLPGERALAPADERGFLWRMNSYWRYEQTEGGVVAEMESITLSRNIPWGVRFLVSPVVDRVARESVERTLRAFRDLYVARLI